MFTEGLTATPLSKVVYKGNEGVCFITFTSWSILFIFSVFPLSSCNYFVLQILTCFDLVCCELVSVCYDLVTGSELAL